MAVKDMQVYECDQCGKLHKYGQLPEGWVFYLHKREVALAHADGKPTGRTYSQNDEHEFCSEKHKDEWIKEHA